jgi:hypothetical protein
MKTTDLTLLPLTVYGTPSGNYDGSSDTAFAGDRQKAADYYVSGVGIQSVRFITDEFEGSIIIQATLDADPQDDADWFDVYEFPDDSSATTANISYPVKGNFTWIRARVRDFVGGQITSVTVTY